MTVDVDAGATRGREDETAGSDAPAQPRRRARGLELALALGLGALVVWVHDVGYNLREPYWLDESWVVVSTKAQFLHLPGLTSSTPIGWTALLRVVELGGEQRHRMLSLAFAGLTVTAGYAFGRSLPWSRRLLGCLAGLLIGTALMMQPALLIRNDAKQYTADAFAAVALLFGASWVEGSGSRRRVLALGAATVTLMLVSHTAGIVGVAVFGGLAVSALVRRRWATLLDVAVVGAATGLGLLAVYLVFVRRASSSALSSYWADRVLPTDAGLSGALDWVSLNARPLEPMIGLGGGRWLLLGLVAAGLVTLVVLHRSAVALAWVVLVLGYVGLGISGDYPVLEQRTSTFLFAAFALVVGVGAAGVCVACGRLLTAWPRYSDRARPWVASGVTLALMAGAAAWYVSTNDEWFRHHSPFIDDVRSQTRYLAEHRLPDDVILVNSSSGWNFGYYWDEDEPSFRRMSDNAVGFGVTYPAATRIVVCRDRTGPAVRACFRRAQAESRAARGSRIWLVRTHVQADERTAWRLALKGHARVRAAASPRLMLVEARR